MKFTLMVGVIIPTRSPPLLTTKSTSCNWSTHYQPLTITINHRIAADHPLKFTMALPPGITRHHQALPGPCRRRCGAPHAQQGFDGQRSILRALGAQQSIGRSLPEAIEAIASWTEWEVWGIFEGKYGLQTICLNDTWLTVVNKGTIWLN